MTIRDFSVAVNRIERSIDAITVRLVIRRLNKTEKGSLAYNNALRVKFIPKFYSLNFGLALESNGFYFDVLYSEPKCGAKYIKDLR